MMMQMIGGDDDDDDDDDTDGSGDDEDGNDNDDDNDEDDALALRSSPYYKGYCMLQEIDYDVLIHVFPLVSQHESNG